MVAPKRAVFHSKIRVLRWARCVGAPDAAVRASQLCPAETASKRVALSSVRLLSYGLPVMTPGCRRVARLDMLGA